MAAVEEVSVRPIDGALGAEIAGVDSARQLGELHVTQELRKEPEQTRNSGESWHVDMSFREEPPMATILLARECPECGGDTLAAETVHIGLRRVGGVVASGGAAAPGKRPGTAVRQRRVHDPLRALDPPGKPAVAGVPVWHLAVNDYQGMRRAMQRVTLLGTRPTKGAA